MTTGNWIIFGIFAAAVILLAMQRYRVGRTFGGIAKEAVGGVREMFGFRTGSSSTLARKTPIAGILLWAAAMITLWILFPSVFLVWVEHWQIFLVSQAVFLIAVFWYPGVMPRLFAIAIVILLFLAIREGTRDVPYQKDGIVSGNGNRVVVQVREITAYPKQWGYVRIPVGYTFTVVCQGNGLVKILGNNIPPKPCSTGNPRDTDFFGDNLKRLPGERDGIIGIVSTEDRAFPVKIKLVRNQ